MAVDVSYPPTSKNGTEAIAWRLFLYQLFLSRFCWMASAGRKRSRFITYYATTTPTTYRDLRQAFVHSRLPNQREHWSMCNKVVQPWSSLKLQDCTANKISVIKNWKSTVALNKINNGGHQSWRGTRVCTLSMVIKLTHNVSTDRQCKDASMSNSPDLEMPCWDDKYFLIGRIR